MRRITYIHPRIPGSLLALAHHADFISLFGIFHINKYQYKQHKGNNPAELDTKHFVKSRILIKSGYLCISL